MKNGLKRIFFLTVAFLVSVILILFSYTWLVKVDPDSFVSHDFVLIFKTQNLLELIDLTDRTVLLKPLLFDRSMQKVYKVMNDLKIYLGHGRYDLLKWFNSSGSMIFYKGKPPLFIFDQGIKNLFLKPYFSCLHRSFRISSQYTIERVSSSLFQITILWNKKKIYLAFYKNLVLFSLDKDLIRDSLIFYKTGSHILKDKDYLHTRANVPGGKPLSVFMNMNLIKKARVLKPFSISGLSLQQDGLSCHIKGFNSLHLENDMFYNQSFKPDLFAILPQSTTDLIAFSFDNIKTSLFFVEKYFLPDRKINREIRQLTSKTKRYFNMDMDEV
ncbi:MAG: hypothetical protein JW827_03950, partial [Spirochaetes bacterium]|nr:hypothetical protein [Spirochaetota bacterium]